MSNKQKKSLVPEVRFPEFSDNGSWSRKKIGSALTLTLREKNKPSENYTGLGVRSHGKGTFLKYLEDPKKNAMNVLYEVHKDDLVVSITFAWEGALAIADQDNHGALVSHRFPTYVFNREVALPGFFKILILDKLFIYRLGVISPGGAGRNRVLNKKDFLKLEVALPLVEEQQKIADCLASIDELITLHTQKLNALKNNKNGLMQQFFPAEGEIVPKLRFREFRGKGDWLNTTLSDLCDLQAGKFVKASEIFKNIKEGLFPCYGGNGLRGFTKTYTHDGTYSLIGRQGALCGNVTLVGNKFHATEHAVVVTPKEGVRTDWLYFMLIYLELNRYATGQAQPGLSVENLNKVELKFTSLEEEQRKIASLLSTSQELIDNQILKIEQLRAHKKGLMQKLFPAMDEVN